MKSIMAFFLFITSCLIIVYGQPQPSAAATWQDKLFSKIKGYLEQVGFTPGGNVNVSTTGSPDQPVIVVSETSQDGSTTVNYIGVFEMNLTATESSSNSQNNPIITYEYVPDPLMISALDELEMPYRVNLSTALSNPINLDTTSGDLNSLFDKNINTGPVFYLGSLHQPFPLPRPNVLSGSGFHLSMALDLTYPNKRSFSSLTITPFFERYRYTASGEMDSGNQRLIINRILIDGVTVLEGNPSYYDPLNYATTPTGSLKAPLKDRNYAKPDLIVHDLKSKIISFPATEGSHLTIVMENPFGIYATVFGFNRKANYNLGIRELEVK